MENRTRLGSGDRLDPYSILRDIIKNIWVALLLALSVALVFNVVIRRNRQTVYTSSAIFAVKSRTAGSYSSLNLSRTEKMSESLNNILKSSLMKNQVQEELGLTEFNATTQTRVISKTNLMTISVTADTPRTAYLITRSVIGQVRSLSGYISTDLVIELLQEPSVPSGADASFTGMAETKQAFWQAFAAAVLLLGILSYFKDTIKSERDITNRLSSKNRGVIFYESPYRTFQDLLNRNRINHLITNLSVSFGYVEHFKKISTNLSAHLQRNGQKVVVVAAAAENEGASTAAANLALALAMRDHRVLLIDADFAHPRQYRFFPKKEGDPVNSLKDLIEEKCSLRAAIRIEKDKKLCLLLNETGSKNAADLVSSSRMKQLIAASKKNFDYVILDAPPVLSSADAEVLADLADLSLLIVRYDHTPTAKVNRAIDNLTDCKAEFYGCILNEVHTLLRTNHVNAYGTYGKYGEYGRYGTYGHYEKKTAEKAES